jgi:hypothetical protein
MVARGFIRTWQVAVLAASTLLVACKPDAGTITDPRAVRPRAGALREEAPPQLGGEVMVCKKGGPAGTYSYHIDVTGGGDWAVARPDFSIVFNGTDMACYEAAYQINEASWASGAKSTVTVTELVPAGMHVDSIQVYNSTVGGFEASTLNSPTASRQADFNSRWWFKYFNSPDENVCDSKTTCATGRMTGGGATVTIGVAKITKGLTLHCDITLSNNLEINWGGHAWHLDKPITSATCIDDPNVDPTPPAAPFDTFIGEGIGRLDGVDGSRVKFTFIDAGEPGGKNDKAAIQIWDAGGNLVLDLPLQFTTNGNLQAHYDQPHK